MADELINPDMIEIGLEKVSGIDFEKFVHDFYPSIEEDRFVPLGGVKDGGADAFLISGTWLGQDVGVYYQASVEQNYKSKIQKTVTRLREFGRDPDELIYVTSRVIPHIDKVERELGKELNIRLKIRDAKYIKANINQTPAGRLSFRRYIAPSLNYLSKIGAASTIASSKHVDSPAVFVFLRQEIDRQSGNKSLSQAVVDSLILWALEGTDPDQKIFLKRDQIVTKITSQYPFAKHYIKAHLADRLGQLSSKTNKNGREINFHRDRGYCLPFETRQAIQAENAREEALKVRVLEGLQARITTHYSSFTPENTLAAAGLALEAVQKAFEQEGLEFAAFLAGDDPTYNSSTLAECTDKAISRTKIREPLAADMKDAVLLSLRGAFYDSTPDERDYFGKLSRTYSLFFGLKAEPRIVQYFQDMASDFYLYVGSDLVVQALSERYVRTEDRRVRTLLGMLAESGAKLILAEPVLEEVSNHLRTTMLEFQNYFQSNEEGVTYEIARNSSKILIRSYFYARLSPPDGISPPGSWTSYINNFCTPHKIGTPQGVNELKRYLLSEFSMEFTSRKDIEALVGESVSKAEIAEVAEKLSPMKANNELARNDALLTFAVYGRREARNESSVASEFGYRTWWLTGESSIIRHTGDLVKRRGARYMMRPEFVLNFMALAPRSSEVRRAYASTFPSLLGIRLANRVKDDVLKDMLKKIKEASDIEPGRRQALIAEYSDQLKADFKRVYDYNV